MRLQLLCIQNFGCVIEGLRVRFVYDLDMSVSMDTLASLARAFDEEVEVLNETRPELATRMESLAQQRWDLYPGLTADEVVAWVLGEVQEDLGLPPVWTVLTVDVSGQVSVRSFNEEATAYEEALAHTLGQLNPDHERWPDHLRDLGISGQKFHRLLLEGEYKQAQQVLVRHLEARSNAPFQSVQVKEGVLSNQARPCAGLDLLMESLLQT